MKSIKRIASAFVACGFLAAWGQVQAQGQELAIRKNIAERLPRMGKIEEVNRTPMPGLYEIRVGLDVYYTDAEGNFLIQGQLIDAKTQRNLTEERVDKLMAIDFSALPVKDAFTIVRGNGKRKIALFEDPNCGYCKHFEADLQKVDNVTVHVFLYPILGPDSEAKSRNLWCARDKGKAWQDYMVRGQAIASATCDASAVARNVQFGHKYKISGTPTMFFADGTRVPGVVPAAQVEKLLADVKQ
jgi:thiol:disulfide interchange protein DsbC